MKGKRTSWRFVPPYGYIRGEISIFGLNMPSGIAEYCKYSSDGIRLAFVPFARRGTGIVFDFNRVTVWHTTRGDCQMSDAELSEVMGHFSDIEREFDAE